MSSGFVTESELAEARKIRQEEWEKVRTPDQPAECPEEPYDGRSLYDRLKEQKMKKDMEYEETHKLKNLIRGLDDDEVQFLELVDKSKMDAEKKQMREEEQELREFRERVATLQEEIVDKKIQTEMKQANQKLKSANAAQRPSQKSLLGVGIKRKHGDDPGTSTQTVKNTEDGNKSDVAPKLDADKTSTIQAIHTNELDKGQFKCIAILPGIGPYADSSDSEISTGSDDEPDVNGHYDLVGRKRQKKKQCQGE